jgi:diguanylate cyclase (GGDEF)-like protein
VEDDAGADLAAQLLGYIERTSDLVGVVDGESRVVYLNEAARKRLGVGDAAELTTADIFPPSAFTLYYDEIRPAILLRGTWRGEVPLRTTAGDEIAMDVIVVGRVGPGGEITGLVTHGREASTAPAPGDSPLTPDVLTGLPRRALLEDRVRVALARAGRDQRLLALIHVDIDALANVNAAFGRAAGDDVLRALARQLSHVVRDPDTVARVGGDEFTILLDGIDNTESALALVHRLRETVSRGSLDTDSGDLAITASFGVAVGGADDRAEELMRNADVAALRAKSMGGGHVVLFDGGTEVRVTTIVDEFAVAVSHGLIRPHVQRIVNLRTGELHGFQGLARWEQDTGEMREAATFIDLVVNTPMAPVVDLAVLRRTAAVAARFARRGARVRAYGHISRRLIGEPRLDYYLAEIAADLALTSSDIGVEISHALLTHGPQSVKSTMHSLHDVGVCAVLSDVHGECDVNEIVDLGFSELRLARGLVAAASRDAASRRIVAAMVALAHALDLTVIAVGVETEREEEAMLDAGCDFAQGYLYGSVVPAGSA